MNREDTFYVAGGTLRHDAPSYVERGADRELYEALGRGNFCYVLTPRQMGKSSLMVRTAVRLRQEGACVVVLDLTALGQNLTVEQWYEELLTMVGQQVGLAAELEAFWLGHPRVNPLRRWIRALQEAVLGSAGCDGRLVLFIDEIDCVRSLPFSTDEFFAAIRECYNHRTQDSAFERLTFCLLGVASPSDLISDTRSTPFNIGRRIELTDFAPEEAAPLARGLPGRQSTAAALLRRILHWTGGHPYLTQRLCQAVSERMKDEVGRIKAGPSGSLHPSSFTLHPSEVDRLCAELFLASRAEQRDDNLLFVRERLLRSEADRAALLDLYRRVLTGRRVPDDDGNQLCAILKLAGVVRTSEQLRYSRPSAPHASSLVVRNRIYARVFNHEWVAAHMPDAELQRQRAAYRRGVIRATAVAGVILIAVAALALTAVAFARSARSSARESARQRQVIASQADVLRRNLYAADLYAAQHALIEERYPRALELLSAYVPRAGEEDLRTFEWRYLWRLCRDESRWSLRGAAPFPCARFSPDGALLAVTEADDHPSRAHRVLLVDPANRQETAALNCPEGAHHAAFSSDGRILAVHGRDAVTVWDLAARKRVRRLPVARGSLLATVAFSLDGKTLGAASTRGPVIVWDARSLRRRAAFPGSGFVALSPDGRLLATRVDRGGVTMWDIVRRRRWTLVSRTAAYANAAAFSPDGRRLAAGMSDGRLEIWDLRSRQLLKRLAGHGEYVYSVAYSPDGKRLATASTDATVRLWEAVSGRELALLRGHKGEVISVAFSPDGKELVSTGVDMTVRRWNATPEAPPALSGTTAALSPDGNVLATGGAPARGITLSKLSTAPGAPLARKVRVLPAGKGWRDPISFLPDGKTLLALEQSPHSPSYRFTVWDVASGRRTRALEGSARWWPRCALSPDGRILAAGSYQSGAPLLLWDVSSGRQLPPLPAADQGAAYSAAFSADSRTLAVSALGRKIRLLDTRSWRETAPPLDVAAVRAAFSPDGRLLAAGTQAGTVRVWETASWREIRTFSAHSGFVHHIAFSPDSMTMLTASGSNLVSLWNMTTGRPTVTLGGHSENITSAAFAGDGGVLVTCSADGAVRLWPASTDAESSMPLAASPTR